MNIRWIGLPETLSAHDEEVMDTFLKELEKWHEAFVGDNWNYFERIGFIFRVSLEPQSIKQRTYAFEADPKYYLEKFEDFQASLVHYYARLKELIETLNFQHLQHVHCTLVYNRDIFKLQLEDEDEEKYPTKIAEGACDLVDEVPEEARQEAAITIRSMRPKYSFDQMILNDALLREIKVALMTIQKQHQIYHEWGFAEIDATPKAILNFYGPPGTGKTMAAHAVAHELNAPIIALNYAEIESKFVGDAPKNLVAAFEQASLEQAVLFFDEADSFLGKRIADVSSGSEQAINSLRSQMLILLEEFEGVVIFATNLVGNYDEAFESRILKHLEFTLPNGPTRAQLIKKMIPSKLPLAPGTLSESQLKELAEISEGFAGRELKNAVLDAITNAAFDDVHSIDYSYFKQAFLHARETNQPITSQS